MKPNPFASLNHFTVPVAIYLSWRQVLAAYFHHGDSSAIRRGACIKLLSRLSARSLRNGVLRVGRRTPGRTDLTRPERSSLEGPRIKGLAARVRRFPSVPVLCTSSSV